MLHNQSNICRKAPHSMIYAIIQIILFITFIYSVACANRCGNKLRAIQTNVLCPGSDNEISHKIKCIIVTKIHIQHIIKIDDVIPASYTVRGNAKNHAQITHHVRRKNQRRNPQFCFCIEYYKLEDNIFCISL